MSIHDMLAADLAAVFSDFGETVTYAPSDSILYPSFTATAVFHDFQANELSLSNAMRDVCQCVILHDDLVAGGIEAPQPAMERRSGDTIERTDQNGDEQLWTVVDATYEYGWWTMVLDRNIRIVP